MHSDSGAPSRLVWKVVGPEAIAGKFVCARLDAYTNKLVAVVCSLVEKALPADSAETSGLTRCLKTAIWAERDFLFRILGFERRQVPPREELRGKGEG